MNKNKLTIEKLNQIALDILMTPWITLYRLRNLISIYDFKGSAITFKRNKRGIWYLSKWNVKPNAYNPVKISLMILEILNEGVR